MRFRYILFFFLLVAAVDTMHAQSDHRITLAMVDSLPRSAYTLVRNRNQVPGVIVNLLKKELATNLIGWRDDYCDCSSRNRFVMKRVLKFTNGDWFIEINTCGAYLQQIGYVYSGNQLTRTD